MDPPLRNPKKHPPTPLDPERLTKKGKKDKRFLQNRMYCPLTSPEFDVPTPTLEESETVYFVRQHTHDDFCNVVDANAEIAKLMTQLNAKEVELAIAKAELAMTKAQLAKISKLSTTLSTNNRVVIEP
jgi:hypothetical protein